MLIATIESNVESFYQFVEMVTTQKYPLLDGEKLQKYFGLKSPLFYWCIDEIGGIFDSAFDKIEHIYKQWKKDFEIVYNKEIEESKELFVRHTYLITLVKCILSKVFETKLNISIMNIIYSHKDLDNIIDGSFLVKAGFPNLVENDYFSWLQHIGDSKKYDILSRIFKELIKFDDISNEDIFREIYQDLITYKIRHSLGEYYTPNWLAKFMIKELNFRAGMKVLDPACGSGTFLMEILREIIKTTENPSDRLNAIKNIVGFDINNLAVIIARANYILMIYSTLMELGEKEFEIPIYLTDSIFPISMRENEHLDFGKVMVYEMSSIKEKIYVSVELLEDINIFRDFIGTLQEIFRKYSKLNINDFKTIVKDIVTDKYGKIVNKKIGKNGKVLLIDNIMYIAESLYNIEKEEKNKIWLTMLYNKAIPHFYLYYFDVIVGNPPWIILRTLPETYGNSVFRMAKRYDIHSPSQNKPNYEIATLFFYRTAKLYLKDENGMIFFILTKGVLEGDQAKRFRKMKLFGDIFVYDIKDNVFRVPCILWKATRTDSLRGINKNSKIPLKIIKNEQLISNEVLVPLYSDKDSCGKYVKESDSKKLPSRKKSVYLDDIYKGAYISPSIFFYIKEKKFGLKTKFEVYDYAYKNTKGNWKKHRDEIRKKLNEFYADYTDELKGYTFQVISSTNIIPFGILGVNKAILPVEKKNDVLIIKKSDEKNIAYNKYIGLISGFWEKYRKTNTVGTIFDNVDYYGKLTNRRQLYPYKVVFNKSGNIIKSAVVEGGILTDNTTYYLATTQENEAHYLCSILNSNFMSEIIKIVKSSRDICKRPFDYGIPKFINSSKNHLELAELSRICHKKVKNKESINNELKQIDKLVKEMFR